MPPEVFKLIRRIEIHSAKLAKDFLAGMYRSAFKGRGIEFEEVKEYQEGDEVRSIDWAVTARMNHPYVKVFREERELTVMLVVDVSASSRFGTQNMIKKDLISEIGALIAFSAIKNNDKVGLILFSDMIEKYIPPKKSLRHVLRVIRELLLFKPAHRGTDIAAALAYLGKVQNKTCVCFLISDFIAPDFQKEARLISFKHDIIALGITDPHEIEMPDLYYVTLKDLESDAEITINSLDLFTKQQFSLNAAKKIKDIKLLFRKMGSEYIDIRSDKPYVPLLQHFFKNRSKNPR